MFKLAALLGIPQTLAMTVLNIILYGASIYTIIAALTSILGGGIGAVLLYGGWTAFVNYVRQRVALYGFRATVLW